VKESRKAAFDPKKFLAKVGDGKTISKYQKDQTHPTLLLIGPLRTPNFPLGAARGSGSRQRDEAARM
jgi:hypothetical protein